MNSLIWFIVLILSSAATEAFGQDHLPKSELPAVSLDFRQIQAFKNFLQKSLGSEGTYHRYLLISAGIIPAPLGYLIPRDDASGRPTERPLTAEMYQYFKENVEDINSSEEKFFNAINRLFGNDVFQTSLISSEASTSSTSSSSSSQTASPDSLTEMVSSTSSPDVDVTITTKDQQQTKSTENTYETEKSSSSSVFRDKLLGFDSVTSSKYSTTEETKTEESAQTSWTENSSPTEAPLTVALTTEYVKFLTDGLKVSSPDASSTEYSCHSEQQCTSQTLVSENNQSPQTSFPLTEEYIQFLKAGSVFSDYTSTDDFETEETLSADEEEFLSTESSLVSESLLNEEEPDESVNGFDILRTASINEFSPSSYLSAIAGKELTPEDIKLIEKSLPTSSEEYKYWMASTSYPEFTETPDVEFPTESKDRSKLFDLENSDLELAMQKKFVSQDRSDRLPRNESPSGIYLITGTPGEQYPNYEDIPETSFKCENKKHIPGFYADQETRCQVFHVCWPGRKESFLCPVGATFNQAVLACDYWYNSNCSVSPAYFDVNTAFKETEPKTGTTGPMVDTLIKATQKDSPVTLEVISTKKGISDLYEADVHFSETMAKHELSEIWRFLPIKAKVFVQPAPIFDDPIKQKSRRSKDRNERRDLPTQMHISDNDTVSQNPEHERPETRKKESMESIFFKVLKTLMPSSQKRELP